MPEQAKLEGIVCAAVTPVDEDYRINAPLLAQHCARVLGEGVAYVSTFGTTGEGASFGSADKIAATHALIGAGIDAGRQIPAIMTPVLSEAAEMLAAAEQAGCRAALVLPPFYYADPGDAGVLAFFEALIARAQSTTIDLVLYNIPRFSRITFTHALVQALIDRFGSRIVGIKDSTGDLQSSLAFQRAFPSLSIFTGDDRVMPPLRVAGGAGMIGGMPNLFAPTALRMLAAPDAPEGATDRADAARRIEAVDGNGGLPIIKAMLARLYDEPGWTRCVPPLGPVPPAAEEAVVAALAETGYCPGHAA